MPLHRTYISKGTLLWLHVGSQRPRLDTKQKRGICLLVFAQEKKNLKENALDIHFSHWTTDQQLEKSELKPKSNENVIVPICCSTLDA